jgi:hypothetical protein
LLAPIAARSGSGRPFGSVSGGVAVSHRVQQAVAVGIERRCPEDNGRPCQAIETRRPGVIDRGHRGLGQAGEADVVGDVVPGAARRPGKGIGDRRKSRQQQALGLVRLSAADDVRHLRGGSGGLVEAAEPLRHRLMALIHRVAAVVDDDRVQRPRRIAVDDDQARAERDRDAVARRARIRNLDGVRPVDDEASTRVDRQEAQHVGAIGVGPVLPVGGPGGAAAAPARGHAVRDKVLRQRTIRRTERNAIESRADRPDCGPSVSFETTCQ